MSVNLNEFTAAQLEFSIRVFNMKEQDVNYNLSALDFWEDSELKHEHVKVAMEEFDTCILFRVQLMSALQEVQNRDKVLTA